MLDANIAVSAFLRESTTRRLLLDSDLPRLIAPEFMNDELAKHSGEFAKKLGVTEAGVEGIIAELFEAAEIELVPVKIYAPLLRKAAEISPDANDVPYFALAMKFNCPIWSQDSALKSQSIVRVLSTKEIIQLIALK